MEILRYVPEVLLKDKKILDMYPDEFLKYLAKARYLQEIEEDIQARAIAKVFGED